MIKLQKILSTICLCCTLCPIPSLAEEVSVDQRFFYIGAEGGIVDPVVKKFRHPNSGSSLTLKKSAMYGAKIGYSFYPQMAIELSLSHQPKYRLNYVLPQQNIAPNFVIPQTLGSTKIVSNVYMVNLIYDLAQVKGIVPFVLLGAGMAQVKVMSTSSKIDSINAEYFKIRTTRSNCFSWQIGLGVSKDLFPDFSVDLVAKLQVINGVKIKYDTLNMTTQQFTAAPTIKKTIGVGEFGIGFTYRLPI